MAFKRYFMMFIMTVVISVVKSQPIDPDPDPGGPQSGAVPVDGGLALLLAAGASYGAKKAYDYRKKKKDS